MFLQKMSYIKVLIQIFQLILSSLHFSSGIMTLKLFKGDQGQPKMNYSKLFAQVNDNELYMFDIK